MLPALKKIGRRFARVLLLLLLLWVIAVHSGCFTMRSSDADWRNSLQKAGQRLSPVFLDIPDRATGRNIHAVYLSASDSLPLLVFSHGSPGASDAFLPYLSDSNLTRAARLLAYDRPGFGYTGGFGRPEPSLALQAAVIKTLVDSLSPGRRVYLVGHSMGGPVIARFAMDYPEQTAGLMIVAGSIDPEQEPHPWWQSAVDKPPLRWLTPKPLWTSNAEIIPLEGELRAMLPLWEKIKCPVRVIHAKNDRLVAVENAQFAQNMLKNCKDLNIDLLPDGDHFILWSRSAYISVALAAWVK